MNGFVEQSEQSEQSIVNVFDIVLSKESSPIMPTMEPHLRSFGLIIVLLSKPYFMMEDSWNPLRNDLLAFSIFLSTLLFATLWSHRGLIRKIGSLLDLRSSDTELSQLEPYPNKQITGKETYQMTMGIKKLDEKNWLTIDKQYSDFHEVRKDLLDNHRSKVIQCRPGSEEACVEVLELVAKFLCEKYPFMFETFERGSRGAFIRNRETEEVFSLHNPYNSKMSLEIAARLAMEDLNVMMKSLDGQTYFL